MDNEPEVTRKPLTEAAKEALLREVPIIEQAILRIQAALDLEERECETCHIHLKRSYRDVQLVDVLKGSRSRLRRWEEEAGGRPRDQQARVAKSADAADLGSAG